MKRQESGLELSESKNQFIQRIINGYKRPTYIPPTPRETMNLSFVRDHHMAGFSGLPSSAASPKDDARSAKTGAKQYNYHLQVRWKPNMTNGSEMARLNSRDILVQI